VVGVCLATVCMLVTLIWLGTGKGGLRLFAALLIALAISLSSAGIIYLLTSIAKTVRGI
jgi:hypothetical protein